MSFDEREDPDEEQEVQIDGLPFVIANEIIDSYGQKYSVFANEKGIPCVTAASQQAAGAPSIEKEACTLEQANGQR